MVLLISCGGGGHRCPDGYYWNDKTGMCEAENTVPDEEQDSNIIRDDAAMPDEGSADEESLLPDTETYTGPCLFAEEGGMVVFDIPLHTVTFGTITVGGESNDSLVVGELWAQDENTKSEFKIATLSPTLTGKSFRIAPGTYTLSYRGPKAQPSDPDHSPVTIVEHVVISGDRSVDLDLPLYQISGSVTKNGDVFPTLTGAAADATKVTIQSGSYVFEIPYTEFASFTRVVPRGTYTATFSGHLADGAPFFYGKILFGNTAVTVTGATSVPVAIVTAAVSGSVAVEGAAVESGVLAIVKDPPLEPLSGTLVTDLGATKNYNLEILSNEGITYTVVYLVRAADYPSSMLRVAYWSDFSPQTTGAVTLDFGRVSGTLSLKTAGGPFPALTSCQSGEPQCTRGRLKAMSMASGTIILKDLGANGDDYTYSALLVRRQKVCKNLDCSDFEYTPQPFSLLFESYFNDIAGMTNYLPFTTKVSINGVESFQFVSGSDFITEMQLDIVVRPVAVSGTVTFDGVPVSSAAGDMLFVKDTTTQTETPVVNLSSISNGVYSFMAPAGSYHVVYKGAHLFGYDQRGIISTDLTVGGDAATGKTLDIGTVKIQLDTTINGQSPTDFVGSHPAIDHYDIAAANDKNALGASAITPIAAQPYPYIRLLKSAAWDIYLTLYVKEGNDTSVFRFPLAQLTSVSSDTKVQKALTIVPFEAALTANGMPVNGSGAPRALLDITGDTRAKVYFPPESGKNAHLFLSPATYSNPSPLLTLGSGFDVAQRIITNCIVVSE